MEFKKVLWGEIDKDGHRGYYERECMETESIVRGYGDFECIMRGRVSRFRGHREGE